VRERPHGPGAVLVVTGRLGQRLRGARFQPGGKQVPAQRLVVHEAVQVRVGDGEGAVGAGDRRDLPGAAGLARTVRTVRTVRGGRERSGELGEARRYHQGLQGGFVRDVLVQRGRLDAEEAGDAPHGKRLGSFGVQQRAGGPGDLRLAPAQRPGGRLEGVRHE
jgi:hypothetical protein